MRYISPDISATCNKTLSNNKHGLQQIWEREIVRFARNYSCCVRCYLYLCVEMAQCKVKCIDLSRIFVLVKCKERNWHWTNFRSGFFFSRVTAVHPTRKSQVRHDMHGISHQPAHLENVFPTGGGRGSRCQFNELRNSIATLFCIIGIARWCMRAIWDYIYILISIFLHFLSIRSLY